MRISKQLKKKLILLIILIAIGITYLQIKNSVTVRAGGRVRALRMEKFWSGDRFYVTIERDNGRGTREYQISEKDYYRLTDGYIIIFMDGHIETLEEYENSRVFRNMITEVPIF